MKNIKILILLSVILTNINVYSQEQSMTVTASYGMNKLFPDLNSNVSGSGGMGFYYNPIPSVDVGFTFNFGTFQGEQSDYLWKNSISGVKFLTNFFDYGVKAKFNIYSLFDPNPFAKFALNISTGIGFIDFRDRLEDMNGEFLAGYGYQNSGGAKPKTTTEIYLPVSLGFKYRYDKNYALSFEPAFVWCNTDKLDCIVSNKKDFYLLFPLVLEYKLYFKNVK